MNKKIDVSFVMTVYNKEYYLPSVLKALLNQTGVENPEYIFVDDKSSDRSVEIIREATKGLENIKIFANQDNRGISIRINQGIMAAEGEYTRMLDSDDIFPLDSTQKMLELARKHNADMVYGTFIKTGKKPQELENCYMEDFEYAYHKDAIREVLRGRYTRMGQLIKTSVLQKSGGADEKVFIQDESIPLRSGLLADGIIKMKANVVLVPEEIGNASGNKSQLNFDRFFAYHNLLCDKKGKLDADVAQKMYMRAISAFWKQTKATKSLPYIRGIFFRYLTAKIAKPLPDYRYLEYMKNEFLKLDNVRKMV